MSNLDEASKVKEALIDQLHDDYNCADIGLCRVGEIAGVKVSFHQQPIFNEPAKVIDGVHIIVVIVGDATKRE